MILCLDAVGTFGETTGYFALKQIYEEMCNHPEGKQILIDRPRIHSSTIDLESLNRLPSNTFGYTYYHFLKENVCFLCFFPISDCFI